MALGWVVGGDVVERFEEGKEREEGR